MQTVELAQTAADKMDAWDDDTDDEAGGGESPTNPRQQHVDSADGRDLVTEGRKVVL